MEKRIVLAFLLSFVFIMVWSRISPQPARMPVAVNGTSTEKIVNHVTSDVAPEPAIVGEAPKNVHVDEKVQVLENAKIRVVFSNIGGAIKEIFIKEYGASLPITGVIRVIGFGQQDFQLQHISRNKIVYGYDGPENKITNIFELSENDYLINVQTEMSKQKSLQMYSLDISMLPKNHFEQRDESLFEYSFHVDNKVERKSGAFKFSPQEAKSANVPITWFGFRDRYFCILVKPEFANTGYSTVFSNEKKVNFVVVPRETDQTNNVYRYNSLVYFGPQKRDVLTVYNQGFEKIVAYSNWGIIDACAKGIYFLMVKIHTFVPNWGLTIILLGMVIYLMTYPLTLAGMSSMRKMQSLQPQMTKLREQYKSNPQKLNQEMMELYKKHKVNPLGGCLPMVIQMPVFIALYQILWRSVILKGQGFLWIKDLSYPDRLFTMKNSLPLIGNDINILPLLMTVVMFFQQKLSTQALTVTDETQAMQQKMMLWFLPIMMFFIFYKAASGLTLYFTVLYLMTALTQLKMSKANHT